jgi:hypothetical protein
LSKSLATHSTMVFSYYSHILDGALPIHLKQIAADSPKIITRFVNACIGWVRYKPLLLYITQPEEYEERTQLIRAALRESVPAFINYFQDDRFSEIPKEFEKYSKNVKRHHAQYMLTQVTWEKIICFLRQSD